MINRRIFFRSLLGYVSELENMVEGVPMYRLSDLRDFSTERLGRIIPELRGPLLNVEERDDSSVRDPASGSKELVPELSPEQRSIIGYFDGSRSLDAIAESVAEEMDVTRTEAFALVQDTFEILTNLQICFPKNMV